MLDSFRKVSKYSDFALATGLIAILMVLLFPVAPGLLDVLLAFSVAIAVVILMNTLFINKSLELSVFPTILLVTTILRLSLNIASTRLILANGHKGTSAAGHVIEAFGGFVMQGNVVIGLIVFLILTIINFVVITKGSGRIAEVAARFSLDSMPGKQMAIDADLSAGLIDESTARERRKEIEDESTFYGAMDGANKFVRGDAIAGVIITFINLVGGMVIGMLQRNMTFDSAVKTYTLLTIGDGLVTQIPSLVISLSAGLLVTKSGVVGSTDKAIFGQLSRYPQSLTITSGVTALMALLPGLPFTPFFLLSVSSGGISYILTQVALQEKEIAGAKEKMQAQDDGSSELASSRLAMDPLTLELGYGLLVLLNAQQGHRLAEQVKALRRQMIREYGFVMPQVRVKDNMQLDHNSYLIRIKELDTAKGQVMPDKIMVMDQKGEDIEIPGIDTKEPTFGLAAKWINPTHREEALFKELTIVDPSTVITTHLTEVVKENITELLSYTEVQKMLDDIGEGHKKLLKDTVPDTVSVATLQKVLHALLAESISVRDLPSILEATADAVRAGCKSITSITEQVRMRLSRQICHEYTNGDGFIPVVTLSQNWENVFADSIIPDGDDYQLVMEPSKMQEFVSKVKQIYDQQASRGYIPILMSSANIRPYVRSMLERFRPSTAVMSQNEVHFKTKIRTLGVVE